MSRTYLRAALVAALLLVASASLSAQEVTDNLRCHGKSVTSNQTVSIPIGAAGGGRYGHPHAATGWLLIVAAGSGAPSVQVNGFGPLITSEARRPFVSCGTLNASLSAVTCPIPVERLDLIVTGCTGACDLELAGCGAGTS